MPSGTEGILTQLLLGRIHNPSLEVALGDPPAGGVVSLLMTELDGRLTDPAERASGLLRVGRSLRALDRDPDAEAMFERARDLAASHRLPALEVRASALLFDILLAEGRRREAGRELIRCRVLIKAHRLSEARTPVMRRRAEMALHRGADSHALLVAADEAARADGAPVPLARVLALRATASGRAGDLPEATRLAEECRGLLVEASPRQKFVVHLQLARAFAEADALDEAGPHAATATRLALEQGDRRLLRLTSSLGQQTWTDQIDIESEVRSPTPAPASSPPPVTVAVRLEELVQETTRIARIADPGEAVQAIVDAVVGLLPVQRAFVVVPEQDQPHLAASASATGPPGEPSWSVVRRTLAVGEEFLSGDISECEALNQNASVLTLGLRTVLCVPVTSADRVLGVLYADSAELGRDELGRWGWVMRALAAHLTHALLRADLGRAPASAAQGPEELRRALRQLQARLAGLRPTFRQLEAGVDAALSEAAAAADGPRPAPVEVLALVRAVCSEVQDQARARSHQLVVTGTAGWVAADPDDLFPALTALVQGAVGNSPTGQPVLLAVQVEEAHVLLVLRDRVPVVADPSVDDVSASREGRIEELQRMAGRHGGTVAVHARRAGGSVIELRLPRAEDPEAAVRQAAHQSA